MEQEELELIQKLGEPALRVRNVKHA